MGMQRKILPILMAAFLSGCVEASFILSPDSRLPKWLEAPENVPRSELVVTMDSYSTFTGGRYVFKIKRCGSLFHQKKLVVDFEDTVLLGQEDRPFEPLKYPTFWAVTVSGVTDIIEHRAMEPVFYMTDDPEIWKELSANMPAPPPTTPSTSP